MNESYFNFEDAMSIPEWFQTHNVSSEDKALTFIKTNMHSDRGTFSALGLRNSDPLTEKSGYSFFALSNNLAEAGEVLDEDFILNHKDDIRVMADPTDEHCGVLFLAGSARRIDLSEW